eukprot:8909736-Alexandrium_andersonii.AAC.1
MSASLVGSEMCIRDRHPLKLGLAPPPFPLRLARTRGRGLRIDCDMLDQPVSYTHLTLPTICSV